MKKKDLYPKSHLIVAAIRLLSHRNSAPPSIPAVCQMLAFSLEQGELIIRKLRKMGAIEITEGSFGTKLSIKDHLKLEDIPKTEDAPGIAAEVERFQSSRKQLSKDIESFKKKQACKQKDLFKALDKQLKETSLKQ